MSLILTLSIEYYVLQPAFSIFFPRLSGLITSKAAALPTEPNNEAKIPRLVLLFECQWNFDTPPDLSGGFYCL
ncbi:hypothetical protein [Scytonema sp. PCC 10023]|uniref:hypothetical protein n=1 Tax=Scytonema sp. PCC 10023 TaxID=1680591 RepID=UPI0039C60511